jgi:hypothetical protein
MLSRANRDHYNALHNELANQYGFGNDLYPKQSINVSRCLIVVRMPPFVNHALSHNNKHERVLVLPNRRIRTLSLPKARIHVVPKSCP